VGIFLAGPGGEVQYVNEAWTEITGLEAQTALGEGWAAALHPDDREGVLAAWARSVRSGEPYAGELRFRRPDGEVRWVLATARILSDDVGRVSGFVGCVNDITERRRLEQEREEFFELALDLLCVAELETGFLKVSRGFEPTLGWAPEELLGRPFLELVHPEDLAATEEALRKLVEGRATAGFENRYRCKDGSWRWLAWRTPPPAPGSRVLHAVARDVTAQRHEAERLVRLAESDALTGAANRSRLEQAVLESIARAEHTGQPFGVLFADLNQFKAINDRLGHAAGDQALKEVARRMREHLGQTTSWPGWAVTSSRWCSRVKSRAIAEDLAAKLVRAIIEPMHAPLRTVRRSEHRGGPVAGGWRLGVPASPVRRPGDVPGEARRRVCCRRAGLPGLMPPRRGEVAGPPPRGARCAARVLAPHTPHPMCAQLAERSRMTRLLTSGPLRRSPEDERSSPDHRCSAVRRLGPRDRCRCLRRGRRLGLLWPDRCRDASEAPAGGVPDAGGGRAGPGPGGASTDLPAGPAWPRQALAEALPQVRRMRRAGVLRPERWYSEVYAPSRQADAASPLQSGQGHGKGHGKGHKDG
jgi:PAS domain S-box-containing protein